MDGRGSIPGRSKEFLSIPQSTDRLKPTLGTHPAFYTVSTGGCFPRVKLTTHLHLVSRPRMVELYLHSPQGQFTSSIPLRTLWPTISALAFVPNIESVLKFQNSESDRTESQAVKRRRRKDACSSNNVRRI
jgi:hypothetical protein